MKLNLQICAGVVALLLTAACGKSDGAKSTVATHPSGSGVDVDVSFSQKQDLVSKMKSQLNDVNGEIEKLSSKASNSTDSASSDAKSKLETLKDKAKNLNVEIDKVQNATESTWNDIKASSRKAFDEAKNSFRDAKDWAAQKLESK